MIKRRNHFRKWKKRSVSHISDVVYKTVASYGVGEEIKLFCLWNETVGGPVSQVAQPVDFRGKTLYVSVRDSVWIRQLKFLEEMIVQKLNKRVGADLVKKIYFTVSGGQGLKCFKGSDPVDTETIYREKIKEMVSPTEKDIDSIADEETRQVFLRIRLKLQGMQNVQE